jgi:NAD+ synthase (glutamine-hydrolysing)
MKLIRVAAGVLNQTPLDWDGNKARILAAIAAAKEAKASILCLPELCITGYGCEDAFHSPALQDTALEILHEILPATGGLIVSLGLPLLYQQGLFDTVCLVCDGRIVGFTAKQFLAGDGIHYEPRWFKPWPKGHRASIDLGGTDYPIGDIFYECGLVRIGFEICEDAWVADRPGSDLALRGVDVILNPSASHFSFGKYQVRERFVLEGSRAFNVSYVYANLLGNEAGRAIYDGDAIIASGGELLATGPRFTFDDARITIALIDVDDTRMKQSRTGSFRPNLHGHDSCIEAPFSFPTLAPEPIVVHEPRWEHGANVKEEEFARAVPLALFDYLRKSRSNGFVVSLSGGADSSAVACLVSLAVERGVQELGLQRFLAKLSYCRAVQGSATSAEVLHKLLTCVYQATENSGDVTLNAAREVAAAVHAEFLVLDIGELHRGYVDLITGAMNRPLDWKTDDLALQNIQARVRSPGVWMIANLKNALLLATSNRSEAAVGYATMDGDTSGGLSPLAGIDKTYLRKWLVWLEKSGPAGLHPLAALKAVNVQAPTAELRPKEEKQTDEADLMPYDLLNHIERHAIRDKLIPIEILQKLRVEFPQYTLNQLVAWIDRFFKLWCRNQWKRERIAPSFHVDDLNLDPRTWCRFPILSGGYEREMREFREYAKRMQESD